MKSSYLIKRDTFNTPLRKTEFLNHLSPLFFYSPERVNTLPFGNFIYKFGLQQMQYFQVWCNCHHQINLVVYCFRESSSGKFQKIFMWSKCKAKDTVKIVMKISLHKGVCIRNYSGPHFSAFGLNTERYRVSLRSHSKYGKKWTKITPNTGTFYAVFAAKIKLKWRIITEKYFINSNIWHETVYCMSASFLLKKN